MSDGPDPRHVAELIGFISHCMGWKAEAAHNRPDGLWMRFVALPEGTLDPDIERDGQQIVDRLYERVVTAWLRRFVTGASLQMAMVSRGMQPGELSELSGVSVSTLRRWSDDPDVKATADTMRRVYNALQKRPLDAPISWDELAAGLIRP